MNKLEQMFYDSFIEERDNLENELCCYHDIKCQVVVGGLYQVDFLVNDLYVIEIDGYEFHKTKEQRASDYRRERYLMRQGLHVIRFTGTEVYLSCSDCAAETLKMIDDAMAKESFQDAMSCFKHHEFMKAKESERLEGISRDQADQTRS